MSRGEREARCAECGETHTEPCGHSKGVRPLPGDYGRRPHAYEECVDCGHMWRMEADGSRTALGWRDGMTGVFSIPKDNPCR